MVVDGHLRLDVRREHYGVVLELHGELDLAGVPVLESEIARIEADTRDAIVLDVRDLQFIDSAGLRTILAMNERAREQGRDFALTRGSQQVQRLLAVAGVEDSLRIVASPDETLV